MAKTGMKDAMKKKYIDLFMAFLQEQGEDVMITKSGTIAFPFCYEDGEEGAMTITFSIPTGTRDGDAYDPYEEARQYRIESEEKARKKQEAEAKKQAKIERDRKLRESAKAKKEARSIEA